MMEEKNYSKKREATQRKIVDVFVNEYVAKNIGEITVKTICQKAEINRTTFYTYFKDVYDIEEYLEDKVIEGLHSELFERIEERLKKPEGLIDALLELNKSMNYWPVVLISKSSNDFVSRISEEAINIFSAKSSITEEDRKTIVFLISYHIAGTSALIGSFRQYLHEDGTYNPEELEIVIKNNLNRLLPVVENGIMPIIREIIQK